MIPKSILYQFCILAFILFTSCKAKKKIIYDQDAPSVGIDSIYQHIFSPPIINRISGRAKIKIKSPYDSQKAVMFLRTIKDSIVWTSFKKLGAEGARALIDQDSVYMLDRIHKTYQIESLVELHKTYGLSSDLNSIQALINGHIPAIDTSLLWNTKEDDSFYHFRSIKDDIVFDFSYDKISGHLIKGHFIDRFNINGYWDYDDYRIVDNIAIPFFRKYTIEFGPDNFLNVTIEFTDLEINNETSIRFEIPAHYKRIY
ncbi:MAG: DUF4292 domain-containing protein [Saprospiraceae bacterium]|nr:DUF4292 domain-containing protein [Saprospiraceae bacterium]